MFGLSFGEVLIIMVVALLVLGPDRLPKVAKNIGKGMREFRRATGGFRQVLEEELYLEDDPTEAPKPTKQTSDGPKPVPRQAPALQPAEDATSDTSDASKSPAGEGSTDVAQRAAPVVADASGDDAAQAPRQVGGEG